MTSVVTPEVSARCYYLNVCFEENENEIRSSCLLHFIQLPIEPRRPIIPLVAQLWNYTPPPPKVCPLPRKESNKHPHPQDGS